MPLNLKMRMIDVIVQKKATVVLKDGSKFTGIGDCLVYLPINDDTDEEEEYLRFVIDDKNDMYLTDSDISEYTIIE